MSNPIVREVQIGNCRLIQGDCREVLPLLGKVDAVVTDPPYGTGWVTGGGKVEGEFKAVHNKKGWDKWSTEWIHQIKATVFAVFCPDGRIGELQSVAGSGTRLRYYVKSNPRPPLMGNDSPSVEPIVIWPRVFFSKGAAHCLAYNGDAEHPCQKPVPVMEWLIGDLSQSRESILDPFMGSGTTGVACVNLGRAFIGVERDPGYFDIACRRVRDAYAQQDLFRADTTPPLIAKQTDLLETSE